MFITKKHLSRRTVLKGAGAAVSLPLLDAMIPAHTALANTAAAVKPRLGFVYIPHGAIERFWVPQGKGKDFQFSRILKPMEGVRDYVTVISGLRNRSGERQNPPHGITEQTWLTCQDPQGSSWGPEAGISIDQMAAKQIGQDTPLSSLELCAEPGGATSYRGPNQSLPLEGNPRKVFYSMFGPGDSNSDRVARLKATDSLLDYVLESSKSLNQKLGAADRALVSDYLESVREVEGRVQKLMAKADSLGSLPDAPRGTPDDFTELVDVQFEMMLLAFQTGQTRIASLRMIKEASMRTFPTVNVDEAFHPLSHHGEDPEKQEKLARVQTYQVERFARFAKRMASVKEGDGNMLDNSIILYGSNLGNSDLHNCSQLPELVLGKGGGFKGGQHIAAPKDTPHANLLLTIAQRAGVKVEKFGDATGTFTEA
ncbi:MAG TPA: DUF1552 domain-containing protein [Steroidobacteraceae bacterium]|nr:DUF1552 domain-containing protein [Steroidobacteraceae bacterium]